MAVEMPARIEAGYLAVEVQYPWAEATRAVTALNEAASTLGAQLEQRAEMIPTLDDWEGAHRDEFNTKRWALELTGGGLKGGLTSLASSIVSGAEDANQQQIRNNDDAEDRHRGLRPGPV